MSAASSQPKPIATWNGTAGVWETGGSLICGHSELFSGTWPVSGMTHGGQAFELPTRVPPMSGSECSSLPTPLLLPTPLANASTGPWQAGRRDGRANLQTAVSLLPTPRATDGTKGGPNQVNGRVRDSLPGVAPTLLPTPAVNDMGRGKTVTEWDEWTDRMKARHGNGNGHGKNLAIEAQRLTSARTQKRSPAGNPSSEDQPPNLIV